MMGSSNFIFKQFLSSMLSNTAERHFIANYSNCLVVSLLLLLLLSLLAMPFSWDFEGMIISRYGVSSVKFSVKEYLVCSLCSTETVSR